MTAFMFFSGGLGEDSRVICPIFPVFTARCKAWPVPGTDDASGRGLTCFFGASFRCLSELKRNGT